MKRLFIIFLSLCSAGAAAQFPAHPDSIYTFIRYNSAWRNTIKDWQPVDIVINAADNFDELLDDKKVKAALLWLGQK